MSAVRLARKVLALTGRGDELLVHTPERPGQVRLHRACARKLRDVLGFTPAVALDEGLERTVEWYRDHRDWWERQLWMRSVPIANADGSISYW